MRTGSEQFVDPNIPKLDSVMVELNLIKEEYPSMV